MKFVVVAGDHAFDVGARLLVTTFPAQGAGGLRGSKLPHSTWRPRWNSSLPHGTDVCPRRAARPAQPPEEATERSPGRREGRRCTEPLAPNAWNPTPRKHDKSVCLTGSFPLSSLRRRRQNVAQGDAKRALGIRAPEIKSPRRGRQKRRVARLCPLNAGRPRRPDCLTAPRKPDIVQPAPALKWQHERTLPVHPRARWIADTRRWTVLKRTGTTRRSSGRENGYDE